MGGGVRQVQSWLTCNTRCGAHIGARPRSSSVALGLVYKLSESFPFYFSLVFSSFHLPSLHLSFSSMRFPCCVIEITWHFAYALDLNWVSSCPLRCKLPQSGARETEKEREREGERGTIACPLWHACLTLLLRLTERRWQVRTLTSAFEWRMKSFSIVARSNEMRKERKRADKLGHDTRVGCNQ